MTRLLFVYNAEAGLVAGLMDSIHKVMSPETYPCRLCAITYGAVRMDPRWRAWLKSARFEAVFHHRADFRAAHPNVAIDLPAILVSDSKGLRTLLDARDFASIPDLDALIARLDELLDN